MRNKAKATLASLLAAGLVAGTLAMGAAHAQSTSLPQVTISMDGSSITVGGTLQSGAVDVVSTVTGEPTGDPILVRLNPGVTANDLYNFLGTRAAQDPNNVSPYGSIVFAATVKQGTTHIQTPLKAADYVAFDGSKGDPSQWPTTQFTVDPASSPATLPAPDAKVKAIDFGFRGARTLHRGSLVRFQNHGFLVHMIIGLRARNLADAKKLVRALRHGNQKAERNLVVGFADFMDPVSHGAIQQERLRARGGYWVLACFMNTQDGRLHIKLGMEKLIHIVR